MRSKLKVIILFAFIIRIVFAFLVWHPDVRNHIDWGERFWDYGPSTFYEENVWSFTWPNQPPGTTYLFAGVYKVYRASFSFLWWINVNVRIFPSGIMTMFEERGLYALAQFPAILSDFGIAWLIYKIIIEQRTKNKGQSKKLALFGALFFLYNPVVWYNSSVWGQYDSVINFLALASFYFLLKDRLTASFMLFILSLYTKASLAIFIPIYLIIILKKKFPRVCIAKSIVYTLFLILIITYPFSFAKTDPFTWVYRLYVDKVFGQQLQVITANAFNIWAFFTGIHEQPHILKLGPLSYQVWGIVLYTASYIPALYFLLKSKLTTSTIFWLLSIVAFSAFMFLTNMHERYLYPLFPVFAIIAVRNKKLSILYWVVSIVSFLNLYHFWWEPKIQVAIDVFSAYDRLLPRLLGLVMFGMFVYVFRQFLRQLQTSKI